MTKVLADLGIKVLLMEAGPMVSMSEFKTLRAPYDQWHRGAGEAAELYTSGQGLPANYSAAFAANAVDEPYTVAPGSQFRLFRSRVLGGRTNHYGRVQLRYSDYDFKNRSMRGVGYDWPISYADVAPYYDKAERLIGVTGRPEGLRSAPDGIFQTPAPFKAHEVLLDKACAKLGIKATSCRQAVITSALNGRPACIYCGQCGRGCRFGSNYASSYVQIFPAMRDRQRDGADQRDGARAHHGRHGQGHRGVVHRQDHRHRAAACSAGPWCCRPPPASRRGCSSTRSRHGTPTVWRTRRARSAST